MAAYIDGHRDRFGVGPICRVLSAALDCGFLTPRGCRRFKSRPVSRTTARHEALARGIMQIRSDFFMAVYGYGKMRARLLARGWTGIGRDQVARIMRGLGVRGVRRGRTPAAARPAKGAGGRPGLVERGFRACAPDRLHVAGITYARMAGG
ncbi:IS3 family transposase, partial [Bifidobacterium pullorum subsp. saeculare]|nr:IS3 family transposase [Bifidobacterium pullorum subsp. saeculare]